MNPTLRRFLALFIVLSTGIAVHAAAAAESIPRERLLMDFGWRFHLGNEWGTGDKLDKAGTALGPAGMEFSDAGWRRVDLPHDWAIELPFDPAANKLHGFKAIGEGFSQNNIGWYRRTFELSETDAGKRLWLEFDGVYRDCIVFVNGWFVGHHESGYSGFRYDITDVARCGAKNVVSVRVDASQPEGWFYEGAGIYRHVWFVKTAPLAVAPDGVFVFSRFKDNVPSGAAEVHMQARLLNLQNAPADATVSWEIVAPDGRSLAVATRSARIDGAAQLDLEQTAQVGRPLLWSPETPVLYGLVTTVSSGGKIVDCVKTTFGIRTVAFDADKGFLLNGRPYLLKGTANHQDHAGVGSALPDSMQYYRIARLKEMGCNAYRTAHNPPAPELLNACDQLGMIVMDENRELGSDPQHLALLEGQVRSGRSHPSVAIWSLGNEEMQVESTPAGRRVAETMQELVKRLDPTRPITYNAANGNEFAGINSIIEVRGWSYNVGPGMDAYHKAHPLQPNVGSEQGSTVCTRGIYANDKVRGYVSAYGDNAPAWAQTAEQWVSFFGPRPWLSGGFVWTGFDYRGEPTPYGWPCISSQFGIMDTCGFPKDNYWYYQSCWSDRIVLHLLPHWNWPGREGEDIDVWAFSNCEEVELFLNGRSLGRQTMKPYSELKWKVPYAPGILSARGYKAGRLIAETKVETTGAPAAVLLKPDRATIDANGEDVAVFTVSIADAQGRVAPTAGNKVSFELQGPGRILGVGNGDPSCHEPDTFVAEPQFRNIPIDSWRWKGIANPRGDNVPEEGLKFDDTDWLALGVSAQKRPPGSPEGAMFRTRFTVATKDLGAQSIELIFNRMARDVAVHVNGAKVSGEIDPGKAVTFDVKAFLRPGDNIVAVSASSRVSEASDLGDGVTLRLQESPPALRWSRSAFNGLAQVIVQSSKEPGALQLTARSEGLEPTTFLLESRSVQPRACVP